MYVGDVIVASGFLRKRRMSACANVVFPAQSCPMRKILSPGTRSNSTLGNVSRVIFMEKNFCRLFDIVSDIP